MQGMQQRPMPRAANMGVYSLTAHLSNALFEPPEVGNPSSVDAQLLSEKCPPLAGFMAQSAGAKQKVSRYGLKQRENTRHG